MTPLNLPVPPLSPVVANKLRWCGGAKYNCAAQQSLIANESYPVRLTIVDAEGRTREEEADVAMLQAQLVSARRPRAPRSHCPPPPPCGSPMRGTMDTVVA